MAFTPEPTRSPVTRAPGDAPAKESSLTLERGLNLLQAVADAESEAPTISDLAAAIGVSRAAVYRLLGPLQNRGLVRREGSKVRLGLGVLWLAGRVLPQLRVASLPALRGLAEQVGATVHLTVADGGEAQAVAVVEPSWTNYHVSYRVGTRHPVHRGAAGRAVDLPPGGPRWVSSTGELQSGAFGVAAPVRGVPGLRASVGIVALVPVSPEEIGPLVLETAEAVAAALK
ncbi:DNA-binding IclR family transcriptional regulator [Saccharopolyspora erythraea NRRL 2338]|uniref:Differentiation regulon (IclR-family transcriptional regulator) n=2 Tax=Saccharopolyspora erythraea TaxID=1836 RepID=A4F616_SACEN|nr:helix-turn-helix domain-containing protein [Saccharopolyspora erythraea]EQD83774.1 IclR family transcriptional regulator [Saccharopolyspora erythraea D]PFG93289.1 DNA-binding IclR family transcriptional regulator [Saccharopolyspora erythraea NRRL 2338]QRK90135.1 helix-turn-helix domain-containing protein [Saccharopolyspora erythraea]CAL99490.1 differentiation regulon (IclR-family transcriptional regulator) [Saccharopolyspora erythraea NRRL 2338]